MIEFNFTVNRSFIDYNNHPITIPKYLYADLQVQGLENGVALIVGPEGSTFTGSIYSGIAGFGEYYQIRFHSTNHPSIASLVEGDKLLVQMMKENENLVVRLTTLLPYSVFSPEELVESKLAVDFEAPEEEVSRKLVQTYRIIRDTRLALEIKALYEFECQLCGTVIQFEDGRSYAEAHHIRPLGKPHNGPDHRENVLCVCPNCHAKLDYGIIKLDFSKVKLQSGHLIAQEHIDYHNEFIYRQF